jgi:hypothetical protein
MMSGLSLVPNAIPVFCPRQLLLEWATRHRFARSDLTVETFHRRYLTLVEQIEQRFTVQNWKLGDLSIWPLARMELYLDMYWAQSGSPRPVAHPFPFRRLARVLRPLRNMWRSRSDLEHFVIRAKPAHAIFLGDGVSLDFVDGAWRDRFSEPLIEAFEKRGLRTFLMQSGGLNRLPWRRPTFAANIIAGRGYQPDFCEKARFDLPDHDAVVGFLASQGVHAPSLGLAEITRSAGIVSATAVEFERVLRVVRPTLAFVVTYYAGLGPPFLLACRRQGILSVDLQHCPQEGAHKAYSWSAPPATGYTSLPAVFWNWSESDAAAIRRWTNTLESPWHSSLHGGHTQLASFLDGLDPGVKAWDERFAAIAGGADFEREILVALQPIAGYRAVWDALAAQVEAAPPQWRWWIRRHPASTSEQDLEYQRLISFPKPNVIIDEASSMPLPVLLRRMSVIVSLSSGAAAEAAALGVPALFLSEGANGQFGRLIERGLASCADVLSLNSSIERISTPNARSAAARQPDINGTLLHLEELARAYAQLCARAAPPGQRSSVK